MKENANSLTSAAVSQEQALGIEPNSHGQAHPSVAYVYEILKLQWFAFLNINCQLT